MSQELNRIFTVSVVSDTLVSPVDHNGYRMTSTANPPVALTIDGVVPAAGDWLLLNGQVDQTQNGLWMVDVVAVPGVTPWSLIRGNAGASLVNDQLFYVKVGTAYAGTLWRLTNANTVTSGVDSIVFAQVDVNNIPEANVAAYTLSFTANPPPAADNTGTIADGNAPTGAETSEVLNDLAAKVNAILALLQAAGIMA